MKLFFQSFLSAKSAVLLLATLAVDARGDWLGFRGPNFNGAIAEAGPTSFSDAGGMSWKVPLPGRGLSSPVVIGDRAFVTTSSGEDQEKLHVLCFNAGDGTTIWERTFRATGRTMTHQKTCVAAPSPVSDGERIFAFYSSNDLICLDTEGNLQWLRGLTYDYPNASNSLGMASSPVMAGGVLVALVENDSESFAAGIDPVTGKNLWKILRAKAANWCMPVVLQDPTSGKDVVALQGSKGIHAVDPMTGKELWHYAEGAATIPSSAVSGDGKVLFVPSNGLTALEAGPEAGTYRQLWREESQRPGTASPLVIGDRVFSVNNAGVLTCANASSGERLWRLRVNGPYGGSPVAAGERIYAFNERGEGQIVDVSGAEGKIAEEIELGEVVQCTPAVSDGAVFVRSDGHLWRLE